MLLLWQLRTAVVIFLLSLAIAAAFRPLIAYLEGQRLSRTLALTLSYLLVFLVLGTLLFAMGGSLLVDLEEGTDDFLLWYEQLKVNWTATGSAFTTTLAQRLPEPEALYDVIAGPQGLEVAQGALGVASDVAAVASVVGVATILSIYWSLDRVYFERLWLSLLQVEYRKRAQRSWREIEAAVGAYIRSETVQAVVSGLLLWGGYRLMELPYPTLLALLAVLAGLIPWVGALFAVVPPFVVGLGDGLPLALTAGLYSFAILLLSETMVEPRFFPRRRFSSLLVVLVVIAMAELFGLMGLIVAPPLAAALQILFGHVVHPRRREEPEAPEAMVEVQERLRQVKERVAREEELEPEVLSLLQRLDSLVDRSVAYLEGTQRSSRDRR
jgi:predicted PurR-regulated permease PerM